MADISLSIAVVGGGLATLNPCSFPLLLAFLSFYAGAEEATLPAASTRLGQGLLAGLMVTVGFIGVFAVIGLPVSLGATALSRALPWFGLAIGVVLAVTGALTIAGRTLRLPLGSPLRPARARGAGALLLFGAGYGAASLGCTLPLFLILLGSSLSSQGVGETLLVFAAFGLGIAVVLMALAVSAALLREGVATRLRSLLPYTGRVSGALLVVCGVYLAYYWARVHFGPSATLADDPLVGVVTRFTAELQDYAAGNGRALLVAAGSIVALALIVVIRARGRSRRRATTTGTVISP
jgi:cytochrome c-type biogenesis protein